MKRSVLFLALLCLALSAAQAQTPEQLFSEANELYQQNKIPEARDLYETILKNGYVNGDLLYNLGNAYYRMGNVAKAILYYERARRLMPSDEDLLHNLRLANLMITDKIEPTPRLFIWDYWDALKDLFSLRAATWLTYLSFVLMLGLGTTVLLARSYAVRKAGLYATAVCIVLFAGMLTVFLAKMADAGRVDEAIVVAAITTIKNGPDASSSDAFILHSGVKVRITDRVNEWVKIRLADGKVGWMDSAAIEVI